MLRSKKRIKLTSWLKAEQKKRISELNVRVYLFTSRKIEFKYGAKTLLNGIKLKCKRRTSATEVSISPGQKQKSTQYLAMPRKIHLIILLIERKIWRNWNILCKNKSNKNL